MSRQFLLNTASHFLAPVLLVGALLSMGFAQGPHQAIFLGSSTSGGADPWWLIDPFTGTLIDSGADVATNNCFGASFAHGDQQLLALSSLDDTLSVGTPPGLGMGFTLLTNFIGSPYGLAVDPWYQRYLAMVNTGSGFDLQVVDGNPNSGTYGQVIASSGPLLALGLIERWGLSPPGRIAVAVPALFNGTLAVYDTDPSSPGYMTAISTPSTSGTPGIAIGTSVAISADESMVTVALAASLETLFVRYDLLAGAWVDVDPVLPGVQHISIPLGIGHRIRLLPGSNEAIVCGAGHSSQHGWIGRLDFGVTPDQWSFTEFGVGSGQFSDANALSLSPDSAYSFIGVSGPPRGLVIDNQTGNVIHSVALPSSTGSLVSSSWRGVPGSGDLFCGPAAPNSSGQSTTLAQSDFSGPGLFHLEARQGPPLQFGYFLMSAGLEEPGLAVSQGFLCLKAPIGRYNSVAGPSLNSLGRFDASGTFQNLSGTSSVFSGFDLPAAAPSPPGGVILPGSTWAFQLWHRDQGNASNFSDALVVQFY
ncbi:MAG TPA: hypothetical protein EYQ25_09025 [Planctomycetes bacterium]|nr:hypothetical protein [Planctomycetota bacterium]HIL37091.1 hypothetical protein [Planctomycetota bacterium]